MAFESFTHIGQYQFSDGALILSTGLSGTLQDGDAGSDTFATTDTNMVDGLFLGQAGDAYVGSWSDGVNTFFLCLDASSGDHYIYGPAAPVGGYPATLALLQADGSYSTAPETVQCFAPGTRIATPLGARAVETLEIGDGILTADGATVPVRWIGRHSVTPALAGTERQAVRIGAGALGGDLPERDLVVTADHGMILDGMVVNASALVDGEGVCWVPVAELPERMVWYHVETGAHDVILAEGAATESFVDYLGRRAFDNFDEYLALYGAERIIPEMALPRVSSRRHLGGTTDADAALTA